MCTSFERKSSPFYSIAAPKLFRNLLHSQQLNAGSKSEVKSLTLCNLIINLGKAPMPSIDKAFILFKQSWQPLHSVFNLNRFQYHLVIDVIKIKILN